jgi:acetoin utilization protein AcuB
MKVRDRMTVNVLTLDVEEPIRKAWELIEENKLRRFPVIDRGKLVGVVTDRDLRNATASSVVLTEKKYHDYLLDTIKIQSIMTPNPATVSPEASLKEAAETILEMKVGGLPVVEGGELVGIITETDLIRTLIDLLPG